MTCYIHADTPAQAFCRTCGRGLCAICQREEGGTVLCPDHVGSGAAAGYGPTGSSGPGAYTPGAYTWTAPARPAVRTYPVLALLLGLIPGVGAIYNGQYLKGLVHAVIFGLIISVLNSSEGNGPAPLFGILLAAFLFYMAFEAFHTARQRELGLPVEEWSFLRGTTSGRTRGATVFASGSGSDTVPGDLAVAPSRGGALGPVLLIGVGLLFLLDTLHWINFREVGRYWPVLLIVGGVYMLYNRAAGVSNSAQTFDAASRGSGVATDAGYREPMPANKGERTL